MGKEKKNPIGFPPFILKSHNIFDFEGIKKAIPDWLKEFGYDIMLKTHKESPSDTGYTIEMEWGAERKVTEYVKYEVEIELFMRDGNKVMIEKDGKQVQKWTGRLEVVVKYKMQKDYTKKFQAEKGTFQHFLRDVYERFVKKEDLKRYEDYLLFSMIDYERHLVSFLE